MKSAILIIDKLGILGSPLALKLSSEFPVVLASKIKDFEENEKIIYVPFKSKFPRIPDDKYSHIIAIDQDGSVLEFLSKLIRKAKSINAHFIYCVGLFSKDKYFVHKILKAYSSSKIVIYGDIFDEKMIAGNNHSAVNEFIYQAERFGRIHLEGSGLGRAYPVFVQDAVGGLIDLVFGLHKTYSLFYLFPKHEITELSLAHMIQKNNPEVTIDFVKHKVYKPIFYPPDGKYLLEDKYLLSSKIRKIKIGKKDFFVQRELEKEWSKKEKNFPLFPVLIFIFSIFSPLIFTLIFSFLGLNTLYFAGGEMQKGNLANVQRSLRLSSTFFSLGKKTANILSLEAQIINKRSSLERLLQDIDLGHKISSSLLYAFNSANYFANVLGDKTYDPLDDFSKGENNLKNAIIGFQKISAEEPLPSVYIEKIKDVEPLIKLLSNASDILPNIFGMNGQKAYLLLLQNSLSLRPGGGLIDAYGILKLDKGKIADFSIHDVNTADKKLLGHAEPPFPIRRYLKSEHWYMRDSNFDVDFVKSATSASNFLNAETGEKINGIIALDLSFIKNILEATGPIYLNSYKEPVTKDNFFKFAEKEDQRFLNSLYKTLYTKISSQNISYLSFLKVVSESLAQKHLMFVTNDNFQNIFTVNGWSSALWDEREEKASSINDFLGINEANLGVNKINHLIFRNVSQKVVISNTGEIEEDLSISYKNSSSFELGGDYKNYLRLILPLDTKINSISINNIPQTLVSAITDPKIYERKNFLPPIGLELEKTTEVNKTIYGFMFNVPVGDIVNLKIKYNLAKKIPKDMNSFSYNLRLFKQPGIDALPYSFSLSYPKAFNVVKGNVLYSKRIIQDEDLVIVFTKR